MAKTLSKWYVSLIVLPIPITYLTNHFSLPLLLSDWKLSIIFSLAITVAILGIELKIEMGKSKLSDIRKSIRPIVHVYEQYYDVCSFAV